MFRLDERLQQDTVYLGRFPLCQALLMKDSRYPWVILVPAQANVFEYFHLSNDDQRQLMAESVYVAEKMNDHFAAKSMNVAALGNVVAQLHVHHIARYEGDPAWPGPVWGHSSAIPYEETVLTDRVEEIRGLFASHFLNDDEITAEADARDVVYW